MRTYALCHRSTSRDSGGLDCYEIVHIIKKSYMYLKSGMH